MVARKKQRKKKKRVAKKKAAAQPTSILDKITPVGELETNLVMLVYGRSGTGKTHFGSTFPRPALFIDTNERGTETIANEEGIDVVCVTDWQEIDELLWALKDGMDYVTKRSASVTGDSSPGCSNSSLLTSAISRINITFL